MRSDLIRGVAGSKEKAGDRTRTTDRLTQAQHYEVLARRLRRESLAHLIAVSRTWLIRSLRDKRTAVGATADPALAHIAQALTSPIAVIRASAETLRDNPDLSLQQRRRVLDVVIAEDQRLEAAITRLLADTILVDGRLRWHGSANTLKGVLRPRSALPA